LLLLSSSVDRLGSLPT